MALGFTSEEFLEDLAKKDIESLLDDSGCWLNNRRRKGATNSDHWTKSIPGVGLLEYGSAATSAYCDLDGRLGTRSTRKVKDWLGGLIEKKVEPFGFGQKLTFG